MDKFDGSPLRVVDRNIRCVFGDIDTDTIDYLEKKECAFQEISAKPNVFPAALSNMPDPKRAQVTIRSCV